MILVLVIALACTLAWAIVVALPPLVWPLANASVNALHRQLARSDSWLGRRVPATWAATLSEGPVLAVLAAALIFGVWAFFGILEDVMMGDPITGLDQVVYRRLQSLRQPGNDSVFVALTEMGDSRVVVPASLAAFAGLVWLRRWRAAQFLTLAIAGTAVFVGGVKHYIHRPRPVAIYDGVAQYSFPSGHAAMSMVLYGALAILLIHGAPPRWRRPIASAALTLILLISFSRIYLGAHWLSDVLAGLAFGIAWLSALAIVYLRANPDAVPAKPFAAVLIAALFIAATAHMIHDLANDTGRYSIPPQLVPKAP